MVLTYYYAPIALFFSLFAVSGAILQGLNKQKYAVMALVCELLVKLSLNYVLLYKIGALGEILAFTGVMSISIYFFTKNLQLFFPLETWINTFIVLAAGVTVGSLIYLFLSFYFGLVGNIIESRFNIFKRKVDNENSKG